MLLEFLPDEIDFLLPAKPLLVLHLFQPSLLILRISSLEAPFRVAFDLVVVVARQTERVKCIVDTGRVQSRGRIERRKGRVDTAGLLLGGFGVGALGL